MAYPQQPDVNDCCIRQGTPEIEMNNASLSHMEPAEYDKMMNTLLANIRKLRADIQDRSSQNQRSIIASTQQSFLKKVCLVSAIFFPHINHWHFSESSLSF